MARLRQVRSQIPLLGPAVKVVSRRDVGGSWQRDHADERAFLKTTRWQRLRWDVLVRDQFTCQWPGCGRVVSDTSKLVADHIVPVRIDPALKWEPTNLQCLCETCHSGPKQAQEAAVYGVGSGSGWRGGGG